MSMPSERPILIAYDGSASADHAIKQAGLLFPNRPATVLTVWRSVGRAAGAARAALPESLISEAVRNLDSAAQQDAAETAREGAELAQATGLQAVSDTACAEHAIWASIVAVAREQDAQAIVVGARGNSGLRSALLGSVSNGLLHHARRPVVVVQGQDDGTQAST